MTLKSQNTVAAAGQAASETSDQYRNVIAASGRWRIIRCKDDIQFIIQRRTAGSATFPWRACAYVLREEALPAVLQRLSIPPEDLIVLTAGRRSIADASNLHVAVLQ